MSLVRRGTGLLLAGLLLPFALYCAAPPRASLEITPPRPAPGEPVRVSLTVGDPSRAGADTDTGAWRLDSELSDSEGAVLARGQATLRGGRAEEWLMPTRPRALEPLHLRVWRQDGDTRTLLGAARIPLEPARPLALASFTAGIHVHEDTDHGQFRWTAGCASGDLEHPGSGDAVVHLRYRCPAGWVGDATLRIGAFESAIPCPDEAIAQLHLRVPRSTWGTGPIAPFEIEVQDPFRPIEMMGGSDERELGIGVFDLVVTPED